MNARAFFYDFGKAIYHIDAVYDGFARRSGVAPTLLWILYALNDGQPHTQRAICADWGLPKSTVNTVVTELRQDGYARLEPVKGTRREMTVLLTESGKAYADRVLAPIYEKEARVYEALGAADTEVTGRLQRITELLEEKEESL